MFPPGGKPRYRRNQCNNSNRRGGIIHRFMRDRVRGRKIERNRSKEEK